MKKFLLIWFVVGIGLLQSCPQVARAQDVESFVQDFYKWYMKQSLLTDDRPVFDDAIFKYVCKCTAKRVRLDYKRVISDSDYYIKGQDFGKELLDNLMMEGPSRPTDRPPLSETRVPPNLHSSTRSQFMRICPRTISSTCGMPLPLTRGSRRRASSASRAKIAKPPKIQAAATGS